MREAKVSNGKECTGCCTPGGDRTLRRLGTQRAHGSSLDAVGALRSVTRAGKKG